MIPELNIAVCDDDKYCRHYMKKRIAEYLEKAEVLFRLEEFEDGEDFCKEEENIRKYDIIFLDIGMKHMNGMETAYAIRKKNKKMEIVFITVTEQYVFEGYKVGAMRYIMKPDLKALLPECLETLVEAWKRRSRQMVFSFVGGRREVLLKELLYIESMAHKLKFVEQNDICYMYGKLGDMELKLSDYHFVRCHQSFLVNLEHIDQINNYRLYLSNKEKLPISRPRYLQVRQRFLQYKAI